MSKSYEQGIQDGVSLWGKGCGKMDNCENCPVGVLKGANVTCQEFAKQFPAKMVSLLKEMNNGEITYAEEYRTRFPECGMNAEDFYQNGMCRRTVFEGYVGCEGGDCIKCWNEPYVGDSIDDGDDVEEGDDSFDNI